VGAGNLWKFLIFLFSTGAVCNYCSWLCFYVLYGVLESNQIFKAIIRTPQGDIPITWGYIIQYLTYYHGILVGLGAFCGLISLVLYGFWAYHCYLISKNTTTNETFKWDDIKRYVKSREKQLIAEKETANTNNNTTTKKKKQDVKNKKQDDKKPEEDPKLPPWTREHLVNTYNHGISNNFYEVFYYDQFSTISVKKNT
jgi:palmitoyltransferase